MGPRLAPVLSAKDRSPEARYIKDPALNLYRRAVFNDLPYSDGASTERQIYHAVHNARDLGTFSNELASAITDWPSEYHLSRQRHCVLRPLGIARGDRVLELGCGCGAITRYLGEAGAEVTALEGASLRARIAAERCRDLPNVKVIVDDLLAFNPVERFDWVLLVGVLEYAPVYVAGRDPAAAVLRHAASLLAPKGRLAVAIENKLGIKYFNGCGEDHVGTPFIGVQGLYGERTPCTFGRRELEARIRDAGLPHVAFRYPFPDYKLARIVLTDAGLRDPDFDAAGALAYVQARDYGGNPYRLFDESLVAREAAKNGVLADLSNSFLVVAAMHSAPDDGTLATAFAAERDGRFAAQTRFVREGGTIRVHKRRLYPERADERALSDGSVLRNVASDAAYVPGRLALEALNIARARGGDLVAMAAALAPWFEFLLARSVPASGRGLSEFVLPGHYLDATPFNLIETADGLAMVDVEWRIDRDIPLGWVVLRSLLHALCGVGGFERTAVPVKEVMGALCERHGLVFSDDDISGWLERERELQQFNSGRSVPPYDDAARSRQLMRPEYLTGQEGRIAELTRTVDVLQMQIGQMHRSHSWRITYPLRVAGELLRRRSPAGLGNSAAEARGTEPAAPKFGFSQWSRLIAPLLVWIGPNATRYVWAAAAVLAAVALSYTLTTFGVRAPRMLFYIAAVAVAARVGGLGAGALALAASVTAVLLTGPPFPQFIHDPVLVERLGFFVVCAAIGIVVSIPHRPGAGARYP